MDSKRRAELRHLLSLAGKRIIPLYFAMKNPREFRRWQANACRQTAYWVCWHLQGQYPKAKVELWEGTFMDEFFGLHEHAYTWMWPGDDHPGILVDVARVSYPVLFETRDSMPQDLGPWFTDQVGWEVKHVSGKWIDWSKMVEDQEYYTGEKYGDVMIGIDNLLRAFMTGKGVSV